MSYRIDLNTPAILVPCTLQPSVNAPGKSICVNEDGTALGVDPNGNEVAPVPPGNNFDSEYTVAELADGFLIYRSAGGKPRGYKMVG